MSYHIKENRVDGWFQAVYIGEDGTESYSEHVGTEAEAEAEIRIHAKTGLFSCEKAPEEVNHVYDEEKDPLREDDAEIESLVGTLDAEKKVIDQEVNDAVEDRLKADRANIMEEVLNEVRAEIGAVDRTVVVDAEFNHRREALKASLKAEVLIRLKNMPQAEPDKMWG